jgi:hypothetical protein
MASLDAGTCRGDKKIDRNQLRTASISRPRLYYICFLNAVSNFCCDTLSLGVLLQLRKQRFHLYRHKYLRIARNKNLRTNGAQDHTVHVGLAINL